MRLSARPITRAGAWLLAVLLLCAAPAAQALCLTPLCSCTVSSNSMVFGSLSPLSASATDASATVRVNCGGVAGLLIPYRVDLSAGHSGNIAARHMTGPGTTLSYNLYRNAARTQVWGEDAMGVTGSFLLNVLGWAAEQQWAVYGRIPGSQTGAAPGAYSDSLTLTLTFY